MEVVKRLKVTADELFDLMMTSAKHDVEQATGEKPKEITTGFTYRKNLTNKLGKEGGSIGTFTKIEKPSVYEIEFKSARGLNKVSYVIEKIDDETIEVTYSESYDGVSGRHDLNQRIVGWFYKRSLKKRMEGMLSMMEQHIKSQRQA